MVLLLVLLSGTISGTQAQERVEPSSFRIGLVADEIAGEGVVHVTNALFHIGYPYDQAFVGNQVRDFNGYSLLVIFESGLRKLSEIGTSPTSALSNYKGNLLWIGTGVHWWLDQKTLAQIFGIRFVSENPAQDFGTVFVSSGSRVTQIFKEDIVRIELAGAEAEGYFIDRASRRLFPSESHFKRDSGGLAHLFAYDVASWWNADPELPWSRPAILVSAMKEALSNIPSVRLRPYPRNLDSAFIVRIEDVDPYQATSFEWLSRAQRFLQEHRARKVPLSVALIPVYVDPEFELEVHITEDSAKPMREWVRSIVGAGGTITQHGYTHQFGEQRTGVGTEFLVGDAWMPFEEQMRRISLGKAELENALHTKVVAFEAPHYKFNEDTIKVLGKLGFKYLFDDLNSPFFAFVRDDKNLDEPWLVVFPETLSYIPIGSLPTSLDSKIRASVDQLLEIDGVILQYNHLYNEEAFTIGLRTMEYVLLRSRIWTTSIDRIGMFQVERVKSYRKFEVRVGSEITVRLGRFMETGLTIAITGTDKIGWVQVNGKEWPVFNTNYVILPELTGDSNTITIGSGHGDSSHEVSFLWGVLASVIVTCLAVPFARRIFAEGSR